MKKILILFALLGSFTKLHAGIGAGFTFPEGSSGEVQFESDGLFDGDSSFTYSTSTLRVTVSSAAVTYLSVSTASVRQINWADGTIQTSSPSASSSAANGWTVSGSTVFLATSTNKVRIGSTATDINNAKFAIVGTSPGMFFTTDPISSIYSQGYAPSGSFYANSPAAAYMDAGGAGLLYMTAGTSGFDPAQNKLRVQLDGSTFTISDGNFGVGTATDAVKTTIYGATGFIIQASSAITIASNGGGTAAAYTLTPIAKNNLITCSDTDGCDVTMGESGMVSGTEILIVNVSANTVNFADTSGVSETSGAIPLGQWDTLPFIYVTDRWVEISSNN